jgi:hypothetical protein
MKSGQRPVDFKHWHTEKTNIKKMIKMKKISKFFQSWYPVIFAFMCLLYSVGLGLAGYTEEAQYSAHWPGTILLFAIVIRQRRTT